MNQSNHFQQVATRVSLVSIVGNLILSAFKIFAGIVGHSSAMISDAVHSASDVFSSIIVIIGVRIAARKPDKEHPYGHERFECVAAVLLSMLLFLVGLGIGAGALRTILSGQTGDLAVPGWLALAAALVSIVTKEAMFWYTKINAARIQSPALMADAWHHRSDALSSVGALIGIAGARMGYPVLDPIASVVICLFILKAAYGIFKDAIDRMVDHACDQETEAAFQRFALEQEGVLGLDLLQTRVFGSGVYVDMEIAADGSRTLKEAHDIAEQVHDAMEEAFPQIKHIMVHVNPYTKPPENETPES